MARGRMLNKKISNSKVVNELPETAQLLYTWLIAHLDVNGCFYGKARMIKNLVFPRKNYSEKKIEFWLKAMEKSYGTEKNPLIIRYFVDGEQYLFMPGFEGEQTGLRHDKETPQFPTFDGNNTESVGQLGIPLPPIPPIPQEDKVEVEYKNIYAEKVRLTDKEYQKLVAQFGEAGTKQRIEDLSLYIQSKGDKYKSHYATILNWERMNKAKGGQSGAHRQSPRQLPPRGSYTRPEA